MPIIRLTDEQRDDAGSKVELAKRMAKRFRPPPGMSADEWESEVLLVLVETVATIQPNINFEGVLYMRCRWLRKDLIRKALRHPTVTLPDWVAAPTEKRSQLDEVLVGVTPMESDIIKLRMAGGKLATIGKAYGVSGRTIDRWHRKALGRIRKRVEA